jgi:hypothetical protein
MTTIASLDAKTFDRFIALQQAPARVSQAELATSVMEEQPRAAATTVAELSPADEPRFFGVVEGALRVVDDPGRAVFAACVVRRNFGLALVVVAWAELLVDGIEALALSVLDLKSTLIVRGIDSLFYVGERTTPYVGPPPQEILGQECPICRIPFDRETRVGACRCGRFFHFETPDSHPQASDEDRLDCFQRAGVCPCRAVLTTEEQPLESLEEL